MMLRTILKRLFRSRKAEREKAAEERAERMFQHYTGAMRNLSLLRLCRRSAEETFRFPGIVKRAADQVVSKFTTTVDIRGVEALRTVSAGMMEAARQSVAAAVEQRALEIEMEALGLPVVPVSTSFSIREFLGSEPDWFRTAEERDPEPDRPEPLAPPPDWLEPYRPR